MFWWRHSWELKSCSIYSFTKCVGANFPIEKIKNEEEEGEEYGELLTSHSRQSSVDVMKRKIGICLIYTTHYDPITRKCRFYGFKKWRISRLLPHACHSIFLSPKACLSNLLKEITGNFFITRESNFYSDKSTSLGHH